MKPKLILLFSMSTQSNMVINSIEIKRKTNGNYFWFAFFCSSLRLVSLSLFSIQNSWMRKRCRERDKMIQKRDSSECKAKTTKLKSNKKKDQTKSILRISGWYQCCTSFLSLCVSLVQFGVGVFVPKLSNAVASACECGPSETQHTPRMGGMEKDRQAKRNEANVSLETHSFGVESKNPRSRLSQLFFL